MNRKELAAGALLLVIGVLALIAGRALPMTNFGSIGPGYFPRALALLLCLLGLVVMATARSGRAQRAALDADAGSVPWRAIAWLSVAILWFAFTVRALGLGAALFGTVFLATLASDRSRWPVSLLLALGLTLFAWLVFVQFLRLPIPMLGTWLR
mgnify:CR=1 FL=1